MNALELADELKEWVNEFEDFAWLTKHETMLRQQQAEIEALRSLSLRRENLGYFYDLHASQQRTIDGDKRLIDLLYEKVEKLQTEIDTYKSQNSSQIDTYRYETMRGNSVLVPSDKLKEMQEKITKYELRHAEQRKRIEELEHMMEKASHYEAMAHAGGFETGYQAAQADFNKENPVKEVFNRKAQEK